MKKPKKEELKRVFDEIKLENINAVASFSYLDGIKQGIAEGKRLQKIEDNSQQSKAQGKLSLSKSCGSVDTYNKGYSKALQEELAFLGSPIKEGSRNWVKERKMELKSKLQKLKEIK